MAIVSFILGLFTGFYAGNTPKGSQIGNIIFSAYKRLKNQSTNYKMALIVRDDLSMGRGKIASQCSHASLSAYKCSLLREPDSLRLWEACGQPKIVLKVNSLSDLLKLYEEATKLKLTASIITDGGLTQIPAGTKTVLAIGPGPVEVVNQVTGKLKLL